MSAIQSGRMSKALLARFTAVSRDSARRCSGSSRTLFACQVVQSSRVCVCVCVCMCVCVCALLPALSPSHLLIAHLHKGANQGEQQGARPRGSKISRPVSGSCLEESRRFDYVLCRKTRCGMFRYAQQAPLVRRSRGHSLATAELSCLQRHKSAVHV